MSLIGKFVEDRFMRPSRDMKASQFEELVPEPGAIVFLGDSITEGGLWHEWFPDKRVVNRGIDGDTTQGVLDRLRAVSAGEPSKVFLLIGTNDLSLRAKPEEIAERAGRIVDRIREDSPNTEVVVQSVMPRHLKFRDRIQDVNKRYRELAEQRGLRYIDLWPALADDEGALRSALTRDNLHLGGAGYRAWVEVLRPVVDA